MSKQFIKIDRRQPITLPKNLAGWVDGNDLAPFIVEVGEVLDTRAIEGAYHGGGSAPYAPKRLLAWLVYGYAKGLFSSRKSARATDEWIPVLYLTGGTHPDHDRIHTFRQRFLGQVEPLLVRILRIAHALGILKLGDGSSDGTTIQAHARNHHALSWAYAEQLEAPWRADVQTVLTRAETAGGQGATAIDRPAELKRREDRLQQSAEVKAEIDRRAPARYAQAQADYTAKPAERAAQEQARGRPLGGKKPQEPTPAPQPKDQVNFTDEDARIRPVSGGGFEQAYTAHAPVDRATVLMVGAHVTQPVNDQQEVEPALQEVAKRPADVGQVDRAAVDNGSYSQSTSEALARQGIEPFIAVGRQSHHHALEERLAPPAEAPNNPDAVSAMTHRLNTAEGKTFYAKRQSTGEPVFGLLKEVLGFRRFLWRGLEAVKGEWRLLGVAFNLKRLGVLRT